MSKPHVTCEQIARYADQDDPIFVLRGSDALAVTAIQAWVNAGMVAAMVLRRAGTPVALISVGRLERKIAGAIAILQRFNAWLDVKIPD